MTFRSVAFLGLSLSLSLPAQAGSTTAYGTQSFRGLEFSGDINCTTSLELVGTFSGPAPNTTSGALLFDKFEWGTLSLDGSDAPSGMWSYFVPAESGGQLLIYDVTVNYDSAGCGTAAGFNLSYGFWSYVGGGAGPASITLVAGPDGTSWTDYTSGGFNTIGVAPLQALPYPMDANPGYQGVALELGLWFPATTASGHHVIQSYVTGTLAY